MSNRFAWALAGNIVYAGCQWLMLAVLARLGSPAMVGEFALALAVCAPIILFLNLQLRNLQATDTAGLYEFGDYLGLRLLTSMLFVFVVAGVVLSCGLTRSILVIALAKVAESVSDVLHGLMQRHERMDRIALSLSCKGALGLAGWTAGLVAAGTVAAAALGLFLGWATSLLVLDIPLALKTLREVDPAVRVRPAWSQGTLRALARQALPLGLVATLISVNTNAPRYVIERVFGAYDLGIFAALAYLIVAGNMIALALAQTASPRLARHYHAGDLAAYRHLLHTLLLLGAALGLASVVVALIGAGPILGLLYGPEYSAHGHLLTGMLIVGGLGYLCTFLGAANTAVRCIRPQLSVEIVVTMTTLALSLVLVPRQGLVGAILALLAGAGVKLGALIVLQIRAQALCGLRGRALGVPAGIVRRRG